MKEGRMATGDQWAVFPMLPQEVVLRINWASILEVLNIVPGIKGMFSTFGIIQQFLLSQSAYYVLGIYINAQNNSVQLILLS